MVDMALQSPINFMMNLMLPLLGGDARAKAHQNHDNFYATIAWWTWQRAHQFYDYFHVTTSWWR